MMLADLLVELGRHGTVTFRVEEDWLHVAFRSHPPAKRDWNTVFDLGDVKLAKIDLVAGVLGEWVTRKVWTA